MAAERVHDRGDLFIDGGWETPDQYIDVTDLAEGGIFTRVAAATPAQAETALEAAHEVKSSMRETTVVERTQWLDTIANAIEARRDEFVEAIVREAGKPITAARGEVDAAIERFDRAIEEARNLKGEYREGTTAGHEGWRSVVKPEPVGTVLTITPYNYPLSTTSLHVAPALAAGNSVILKPASKTPVSASILAECISEADLPEGAFNFVPGHGSEIGDLLAGDDRINAIAMTASSPAGKHVASVSGMVNLHMELGGNAPAVVFPDADLDEVANACTKGSFKYAGQRCSAVSRVLAHETIHDDVVDLIEARMDGWKSGDLFDESTTFGPLIDESQAAWVEELVDDAVDRGASLVRGGERDGRFFKPTLLARVPHDARIIEEEQFGPVAIVTQFGDEDEALALANTGDLALDAAVFTKDYDRAFRFAEQIDTGSVRVNGAPSHGLGDIPFGGNRDSGIGREGIGVSIESFIRKKSIIL
ncbi:MAG: aldehyde dehydrogenase [Halobacteriales archaeon]